MPDELPEGHIQMADKFRGMTSAEEEAPASRGRGRRGEPAVTEEPAEEPAEEEETTTSE
jgi:hypothetical protein